MSQKEDGERSGLPLDEEQILESLLEAAHNTHREGLVVSTSGNLSARLDERRFAITAARAHLARLRREELLILPIHAAESPESLQSDTSPQRSSRETPMHRAMYETYPGVRCVLHCQSVAATALACRSGPLPDLNFLPEISVYVRQVAEVPYSPPGSEALAAAVVRAFRNPEVRLVQLRNHGQVVIGGTPQQALERAVFFELAAKILLLCGDEKDLRRFTPEELKVLRSY